MGSKRIVIAALLGISRALDCSAEGLEWLNKELRESIMVNTPPSETNYDVFFNPCDSVKSSSLCKSDDHLCVVETVFDQAKKSYSIVSAIKPYGSKGSGAIESFEDTNEKLTISYSNASWGLSTLKAVVTVECGDVSFVKIEMNNQELNMFVSSPGKCGGNSKAPDNGKKQGGWGFFTWLFFLALIVVVGYVLLTVYINFAQSRGNLPLAADVGDVLRDLPYLLRDIFRKLNFMGRSSSSGYSAL